MANCLKHTVFRNSLYAIQVTQCTAFSLHNSYSVSGFESETPMSIRIPSALIFMWRLFCWQCKCFKVEKDLSSGAAYFKYYVTGSSERRKNGCARRRHAKGLPLPSHVSLWCARPFLRPLLPSTCYAGYTL